jgi:hypothetical protein
MSHHCALQTIHIHMCAMPLSKNFIHIQEIYFNLTYSVHVHNTDIMYYAAIKYSQYLYNYLIYILLLF